MKEIYVIAIVLVASWNVFTATGIFNRDKSESIRKKYADQVPTSCPPIDANDTVVHLAHETDCTKAYKCAWGARYPFQCPWMDKEKTQRLHFNRWRQYCDWPAQAGCISCPGNKDDGYPSAKLSYDVNNCNYYYDCINGAKQLRSCANALCFSATCQNCVKNRTGGNCN